ncbi:Uncharacterised protein [Rothia aeria]|uniref:Uncharacterized protein n=1 Tax=Rothia aeria TaxID=172042 RepID=A0A7Z9D6C4_9MICC|nr:hypothetical protein [Rothia aeria]VEI24013.1 Uncharacterised protein [Rothia aeria]
MLYEQHGSLYKIKNNTSRSIFEDVVKAYHAGAYRSAIGALWALLVFDITIKISNNSVAGDKKSKEKFDDLKKAINKSKESNQYNDLLKWENSIISYADTICGIIDESEKSELELIKEERNRLVHPNWFLDEHSGELYVHMPSADTIDYMISVVYRSILTKDSYSIDFMVTRLTEDIKNSVVWGNGSEKIIHHFRETYFAKISSDKAIRNLFKILINAWMDPEGLTTHFNKTGQDPGPGLHIISRRSRFIVRALLNSEYHDIIIETVYSSTQKLLSSYMGKEYESDLCSLRLRSLLEDKGNLDLENIMSKLSINKYSYHDLQERHRDKFNYTLKEFYDNLVNSGVFHTKIFENPVFTEYFKDLYQYSLDEKVLDLLLDESNGWIEPNAYSNDYFKYLAQTAASSYDFGTRVCRAIGNVAPYIEDEKGLREFISRFMSDSQYRESYDSVSNIRHIFDNIPQRFKVHNVWEEFLNSDLLSGTASGEYGYSSCEDYVKLKRYIEGRLSD